jgi:hypothetical protein
VRARLEAGLLYRDSGLPHASDLIRAVDVVRAARDPARVVRDEEACVRRSASDRAHLGRRRTGDLGHLLGHAEALERREVFEELDLLLRLGSPEELGVRRAGGEADDADALGAEGFAERADGLLDGALCVDISIEGGAVIQRAASVPCS